MQPLPNLPRTRGLETAPRWHHAAGDSTQLHDGALQLQLHRAAAAQSRLRSACEAPAPPVQRLQQTAGEPGPSLWLFHSRAVNRMLAAGPALQLVQLLPRAAVSTPRGCGAAVCSHCAAAARTRLSPRCCSGLRSRPVPAAGCIRLQLCQAGHWPSRAAHRPPNAGLNRPPALETGSGTLPQCHRGRLWVNPHKRHLGPSFHTSEPSFRC